MSIIGVLYSLRGQPEPCCILLSQLYTGSLYSILCTGFLFTLVCVMQSYMRLFIIGFSTSLYGSVVCMLALRASGPGFASRSADVIFRVNVQILTSLLRTFLKMTSDVKTTSDGKKKASPKKMHLSEPKNSLILRVVFFRTWAGFEPPLIAVDWSAILIFVRVTWRQSENPRQPPGNPRNGRQRRRSPSPCRRKIWWLPWYSN